MAGARIGLAETRLVLDANGAYRAAVRFRMDNSTEQFLKVELPEGAELWTAVVAGEPVKPTADPAAKKLQRVGAAGKDGAGRPGLRSGVEVRRQDGRPGPLHAINFPLVHTKNINIEQSMVQLHLPESLSLVRFRRHHAPGRRGRRGGRPCFPTRTSRPSGCWKRCSRPIHLPRPGR